MPKREAFKAKRGDRRDQAFIEKQGGMIPGYLCDPHSGGYKGFKSCKHKTDKLLGCSCDLTDLISMQLKAREELKKLLRHPPDIQGHVITPKGYLSFAIKEQNPYFGHRWDLTIELYEFNLFELLDHLESQIPPLNSSWYAKHKKGSEGTPTAARYKFYMDKESLSQATVIGITDFSASEIMFVTPIPSRFLAHTGYWPRVDDQPTEKKDDDQRKEKKDSGVQIFASDAPAPPKLGGMKPLPGTRE